MESLNAVIFGFTWMFGRVFFVAFHPMIFKCLGALVGFVLAGLLVLGIIWTILAIIVRLFEVIESFVANIADRMEV